MLHEMLAAGLPNNRQLDGRADGRGEAMEMKEEANVERVREGGTVTFRENRDILLTAIMIQADCKNK